jgi:hypothetical protein
MTSGVRQVQVVQGDIAANRLLAEGWVYLQSVVIGGAVGHVLGHSTPANLEDRRTRILHEAVPISRTASLPVEGKSAAKEKWI